MMEMTNHSHNSGLPPIALCFKSLNNSCPKIYTYSPFMQMLLYVLLGAVSLLTVFGNLMIMVTVLHFKQLHTSTNYLILSLAVADMFVGALLMPFMAVQTIESCWYSGQLHCSIHTSLLIVLITASVFTRCFIAVDRYFAVCHPLSYQTTITPSVTAVMIFFTWNIAALFGVCYSFLVTQNDATLPTVKMCEGICSLFTNQLPDVLFPILVIYFPGFIMICIYLKIYSVAKRQAMLIQDRNSQMKGENVARKTEIKATRTLAIVMGVFLLLCLPFYISNFLHTFTAYSQTVSSVWIFTWIGCLNCTCNPIIYALFYAWYRRAFKIIFSARIFQTGSEELNLAGA